MGTYDDAQDEGYEESDGGDSWHSEELKTPPNSEDELEEVDSDEVFPVFRDEGRFGELSLVVGMTFTTKMEFKEAVCEYCIQEGRRIWFKKNDNIKMFNDDHSCARETKNRLANRKWLAEKLVKKLRKYPNLRHCKVAQYFKTKCDLELSKCSLTWALGDARAVVYGDAAAQYGMVRDYGLTLLRSNPGSTVTVGVIPQPNPDDEPIFEKIPLIGLDGAFLKTQHGGQILSAIGQDANNHIYVIAYAIVLVENTENWRWFLELLHQDLGNYKQNKLCFISDMQKAALAILWKDLQLRGLLWECARCTSQDGFLESIKKIERVNKEACEYLNKWPRDSWSRAFFSNAPKIDNICNNACEVFNSRIKEARAKPIITLLEEVRLYAMRSISRNKVKLSSSTGILPPIQRSRLEKIRKESKSWVPMWSGDSEYEKFEVHEWPTNMVVDLENIYNKRVALSIRE
ncbi:uncharacterized protein LOC107473620 [Arachis duranensis]|uniref:Uncharacterized protein LOC107473620 n=1 Tax=Arachis duranensis TaxID=130453 RepID=A0A6P4CBZ0_ARADU|nr:uncharacterized protein LOC107473620 [Arachis duranensis]